MSDLTIKTAVLYDPATGAIRQSVKGTLAQIEANAQRRDWTPGSGIAWDDAPIIQDAYLIVADDLDLTNKKVSDGQIVDVDDLMFRVLDDLMSDLRFRRNSILRNTDWVELPTAEARLGSATVQAWLDYRQALRDLTDNPPENIEQWPVDPEGNR